MPSFSLKNATRTQISIRSSITIHFYTGVTPAAYRLDAFRINYRKGDLIGTYVYLAFQKPFRESLSSGTSHLQLRAAASWHGSVLPAAGRRLFSACLPDSRSRWGRDLSPALVALPLQRLTGLWMIQQFLIFLYVSTLPDPLLPVSQSPISSTQKKLPLSGEFFHSADAEIILRS